MDPFNSFILELKQSLSALQQLHSDWIRLPTDEYTLAELKASLATTLIDFNEIKTSISALEDPALAKRLGLGMVEINARKLELLKFENEISIIRESVAGSEKGLDSRRSSANAAKYTYAKDDEQEDLEGEFEREQQSLLMERQDSVLGSVSSTVGMLRQQARAMGREVFEQNVMLDDLSGSIDNSSQRLSKAQLSLRAFAQESKSPATWCIILLIAVLIILLFCILFI